MKQIFASQLAEWIHDNTRGYTRRDGNRIKIEGEIDAYELLLYVQSLLSASKSTSQIHADNQAAYTGRGVVEGV